MEFGGKLRKLRSERGISQQKLADAVFVSRSAVAKWENGLGLPSEESVAALANFFRVPQDFFKTDTPEVVVIEKNKKIKRVSASMCAVIVAAVFIFIVYMLFRPARYYASARWDMIEIHPASEGVSAAVITDKNRVEDFVDLLNSVDFRRALRISNEAPDHLLAVFYARGDDGIGADVWLCSTANGKFSVYIWNGTEELIACNAEKLGRYMVQMIEN